MDTLRSPLGRRQPYYEDDDYYCSWWTCDPTAAIIKWVIVGVILVFLLVFVLGGYYHAQRRMRRGQAPLRYHRWLISRHARERFFPSPMPQNSAQFYRPTYGPAQTYQMNNYGYAAPPPAYNEADHVPVYTPPTKVNPDQSYAPPPGSPPPRDAAAGSSSLQVPGPSQPPRVASPFGNNK